MNLRRCSRIENVASCGGSSRRVVRFCTLWRISSRVRRKISKVEQGITLGMIRTNRDTEAV